MHCVVTVFGQPLKNTADQDSGTDAPEVTPTVATPSSHDGSRSSA